jgi:hypothetical protein
LALHFDNEDVVSNALRLRMAPPRGYDEEFLAQDLLPTMSDAFSRSMAANTSAPAMIPYVR